MAVKPMLGDLELEAVDEIEADQDRVLAQHAVPGLEGDFLQELGRRATTITVDGVLAGEGVGVALKALREKFLTAAPVPFASDIATATRVSDVLIEEMGVREVAGRPDLFTYAFTLREFLPAPKVPEENPPEIPPRPPAVAALEVEVIVEGQPEFDFANVVVTVDGASDDGTPLTRTLVNRTGKLWIEDEFPPGRYTARAVVVTPAMQDQRVVVVPIGTRAHVTLRLRAGQVPLIAKVFTVHFHFDRAFVEPCMRPVLEQVAAHAKAHPDQHILIVGHTDLTGTNQLNQSLSERRARSVFAFLTSASDPAGARAEWDELRLEAAPDPTLHDKWGRREQQWILRDLGMYHGNIDFLPRDAGSAAALEDAALTDAAIRRFQTQRGLVADGQVGALTWEALIDAYLAVNPLSVDPKQFLPNAADGCDGGPLKWVGCGEFDPVQNFDFAWRRNRRTEILFVVADTLPSSVARPDTFALRPPSPSWCLDRNGTVKTRTCFVRPRPERGPDVKPKELCPEPPVQERWPRQPAEPGDVAVSGRIAFDDGTPLTNAQFVVISPDGRILPGPGAKTVTPPKAPKALPEGVPAPPDSPPPALLTGEHLETPLSGWPIGARTDSDGRYSMLEWGAVGVYTMEVRERVVVRRKGAPVSEAKGNVVCARLSEPQSTLDITVTSLAAASVRPSITLSSKVVVVVKPGTTPQRQQCRLGTDSPGADSGAFTRSSDAVLFFDAAVGGNELAFDGTDNVFTGAQLAAGVVLFAEGDRASTALDDVELRLAITVGGRAGFTETARMTAVELTLDICVTRTDPSADPAPLPAAEKINPGRFLHTALPDLSHERALLVVRPPAPATFTGDLLLTRVSPGVRAFAAEQPAAGQPALADPHVIPVASIPAGGLRLFAEGVTVSGVVADTGFLLGIRNGEPQGDRAAVTVGQLDLVDAAVAGAPPAAFARVGLWDNAFELLTPPSGPVPSLLNNEAEADNFVGADSRRFFFRLRDVSRAGQVPAPTVEWRTTLENDDPIADPASRVLTLVETQPGSGLFLSRAVMLVTDSLDNDQGTHTGLPGGSVVARGARDHRLRLATVRSNVVVEYPPAAMPAVRVRRTAPVFDRTAPDSRRRLPLQVFVMRLSPGGKDGAVPIATVARDLHVMVEVYARLGIELQTIVAGSPNPASVLSENRVIAGETLRLTGRQAFTVLNAPIARAESNAASLTRGGAVTALVMVDGRPPAPGEVQVNLTTGKLTFHPSQQPATGDKVVVTYTSVGHRAVLFDPPAAVPADGKVSLATEIAIATDLGLAGETVKVVYVRQFDNDNRGESFTRKGNEGTNVVGYSFIRGINKATDSLVLAHEVGHLLTDKPATINSGHYVEPSPPLRLRTAVNLMKDAPDEKGPAVTSSKRLWDAVDVDGVVNQFKDIRKSTFTRPFS